MAEVRVGARGGMWRWKNDQREATMLALKMEGGQELKRRDEQQNLEKARKQVLLWNFQRGMPPWWHLDFNPVSSMLDFWPTEL